MTGNWHVLGAGAQGLLFYAYASKAQQQWTLIARDCPSDQRLLYHIEQQKDYLPLRCAALNDCKNIAQILVCVKSTQIESALAQLTAHLRSDAVVVLALNGVSWLKLIDHYLPSQHILLLSSTHGSFRPQPWQVVDSGRGGKLLLGPGPRAPIDGDALATQWDGFGLNCQWQDDIVARLWHKAAVNSCINPLTALLDCRNGELLNHPKALEWLPLIIAEISAILAHTPWPLTSTELERMVNNTCHVTASNYSSMQQDFRHGRETEIDAIVGAYIEQARAYDLPCPRLSLLCDAIKAGDDWSSSAIGR